LTIANQVLDVSYVAQDTKGPLGCAVWKCQLSSGKKFTYTKEEIFPISNLHTLFNKRDSSCTWTGISSQVSAPGDIPSSAV